MGCEALVAGLAAEAEAVVRRVLPAGTRCALVGFPNHDNAGDSAIWVGEKRLLERLGAEVVHACDVRSYSPGALDAALGDGRILLHGGGNLGDIWERQQELRERVLQDFPGVPVLQLPQSIHFAEEANAERFARTVRAHGDVVLLAREDQSFDRARALGVETLLCPDLAFLLGALRTDERPVAPIVWLARTDRESRFPEAETGADGVLKLDWIRPVAGEPPWPPAAAAALERVNAITRQIADDPASATELSNALLDDYDAVAAQRVERGCRILARGRVVVTDRLHGHIFSILLGRPHVVLDQSYGKTRSMFETWTRPCRLATWAETPAQALAAARSLLR